MPLELQVGRFKVGTLVEFAGDYGTIKTGTVGTIISVAIPGVKYNIEYVINLHKKGSTMKRGIVTTISRLITATCEEGNKADIINGLTTGSVASLTDVTQPTSLLTMKPKDLLLWAISSELEIDCVANSMANIDGSGFSASLVIKNSFPRLKLINKAGGNTETFNNMLHDFTDSAGFRAEIMDSIQGAKLIIQRQRMVMEYTIDSMVESKFGQISELLKQTKKYTPSELKKIKELKLVPQFNLGD